MVWKVKFETLKRVEDSSRSAQGSLVSPDLTLVSEPKPPMPNFFGRRA